jgi:DME family drug/metabolite transporter
MRIRRTVPVASLKTRQPVDLQANASAAMAAAAFLLWTWALSRITPTQVAVYVNLNPIVAALLGIALLGERRSPMFVLGFAAVVGGVLLVNWPGTRRN